jgi:hypothetical protein
VTFDNHNAAGFFPSVVGPRSSVIASADVAGYLARAVFRLALLTEASKIISLLSVAHIDLDQRVTAPRYAIVMVVDLINDKTGLEDNHVGDHGIVGRISVFGDIEIFLDNTRWVGEEGLVGADPAAIFIRLSDIVRADRDKPAIGNLELTMEFNEPFILPPFLGAETSAAEDENH